MVAPIADKLEALRALCAKHYVQALYLFGSATREDFDPTKSDLDFLVEFKPQPLGKRAEAFFGLQEDLKRLFGRSVDLGEPSGIRNAILKGQIERSKVALYAAA